ncbi:MAG: methyltransferase [Candidatus Cloacimonetes bacterium]|nr:methyltransferase [Candidatus Cloacimonadota bacterium]
MKKFYITDHAEPKSETYLNDQFAVLSRSGLNNAEKHLINELVFLKEPKRILIAENRTGAVAMIAKELYPEAEICVHNIDKYYTDKIEKNLRRNKLDKIKVFCTPDIPEEKYDAVFIQCSKANAIKELYIDWVDETYAYLKKKGKLVVGLETREVWLEDHIKLLFGSITFNNYKQSGTSLISRKNDEKEIPLFPRDSFECRLTAEESMPLTSRPGVFAHHRVDGGAYSLMHIAEAKDGDKVFDMGCGIGTVGIGLAKKHYLSGITFVDSNARALESTRHNCKINKIIDTTFILDAEGATSIKNSFDVYLANPPYFTQYKIAELFVETGYRVLKRGGNAWLVARNADKLKEIMMELFGNAKVIRYEGYEVVVSKKK